MCRKNVLIVGASSGIGKELTKIFSKHGYIVGIAARRFDLLAEIAKELSGTLFIKRMDIG
jgi:short-subunit dehydrogenase